MSKNNHSRKYDENGRPIKKKGFFDKLFENHPIEEDMKDLEDYGKEEHYDVELKPVEENLDEEFKKENKNVQIDTDTVVYEMDKFTKGRIIVFVIIAIIYIIISLI